MPPPGVVHHTWPFVVAELDEQCAAFLVEHERADRDPFDGLEPVPERAEPAQPLGVRNCGVRGRGRREDEEADVADRSLLRPVVGAGAERSAVGLLADERDRSRAELEGDAPEAVGRVREVGATQVARPGGRAGGRVRRADAVVEQLELLARLEQPRREPGVVEKTPEVVARVGEVRLWPLPRPDPG